MIAFVNTHFVPHLFEIGALCAQQLLQFFMTLQASSSWSVDVHVMTWGLSSDNFCHFFHL